MKLYYIIGTTCAGKDYLIESAIQALPKHFGAVQVGKEFRRRYPPNHFDGLGAMQKTEDEAYNIFKEQLTLNKHKAKVLVAGQPRLKSQINRIFVTNPGKVVWLNASEEVIRRRIHDRFRDDHAAQDLAIKRVVNDKIQMYDVLFELSALGVKPMCFNTDNLSVNEILRNIIDD